MRPIFFLDIDDVLCLNEPYSGFDVVQAVRGKRTDADTVLARSFSEGPLAVLRAIHDVLPDGATYVVSSSWRLHLTRAELDKVFRAAGAAFVADGMLGPDHWATPEMVRGGRADEIRAWLDVHHRGEAFVILDDNVSGDDLSKKSMDDKHEIAQRLVLCEVGVASRLRTGR
jgi:hypothetical protein